MEIVTVIVLASIVSLFAFSRLDINAFRSAAFEQEIKAAVRFAQKFALVSGCDVQVNLAPASDSYALLLRDDAISSAVACINATAGFNTPLVNPSGGLFSGTASVGVDLSAGTTFFYNREGVPSVAGISIVIDGRTVTIENVTGFVY